MTGGSTITVLPIDEVGVSLYERSFGTPQKATEGMIRSALSELSREIGDHSFSDAFLLNAWTEVVDAWRLTTWEAYRDVARLGRKTRLGEKQRATLWEIFSRMHARLDEAALFTPAMIFAAVTAELERTGKAPFHHVVVDEAQDINVPQLRFLAALAGDRPDGLFFAGDSGQRIFQTPFSWKSLGVDVRGRSHTLRINYRTSHQIRRQADRLLDPEIADVDGNVEDRRNAVSVFNGPDPEIRLFDTEADEVASIGEWIRTRVADGVVPEEIGVFVRAAAQVPRAREVIKWNNVGTTWPWGAFRLLRIVVFPCILYHGHHLRPPPPGPRRTRIRTRGAQAASRTGIACVHGYPGARCGRAGVHFHATGRAQLADGDTEPACQRQRGNDRTSAR